MKNIYSDKMQLKSNKYLFLAHCILYEKINETVTIFLLMISTGLIK